jgi:nucleosome binding factor SPN SPT16 subunit
MASQKYSIKNLVKEGGMDKDLYSQVQTLIHIMNRHKAGPQYKDALHAIIGLAEKHSGKPVHSLKGALLALDMIDPKTF